MVCGESGGRNAPVAAMLKEVASYVDAVEARLGGGVVLAEGVAKL